MAGFPVKGGAKEPAFLPATAVPVSCPRAPISAHAQQPYLVIVMRGQQGQQQQQGPVLITMGVSLRALSRASFPPKPSTMISMRR